MKKLFTGIMVVICIVVFFGTLQYNESIYHREVTVAYYNDTETTFMDYQGNYWACSGFYGCKGDKFVLKMNDQHSTGYIYDDIIMEVLEG